MSRFVWVPLMFLLGCADEPSVTPPLAGADAAVGAGHAPYGVRGGARIKAVLLRAAAGPAHLVGWHDWELQVDCAFSPVGLDQLRCVPRGPDVGTVSGVVFEDAACTQRLGQPTLDARATACPLARFALESSQSCGAASAVYRVGSAVTPASVFRREGSTCVAQATPPGALFRLDFVSSETLARGTLRTQPARDGIVPIDVETHDGARGPWGMRDSSSDLDCDLHATNAGARCIPTNHALVGFNFFADANCQALAAVAFGCAPEDQRSVAVAIRATVLSPNGVINKVFRGGGRLGATYSGTPQSCRVVDNPFLAAFAVGAEISPSVFPSGSIGLVADGAGLTALVHSAGNAVIEKDLRSAARPQDSCLFAAGSDGVLRCHAEPVSSEKFADDRCILPVLSNGPDAVGVLDAAACPARARTFRKGAFYEGPLYRREGGRCVFDAATPDNTARTMHHVYEEIPSERLLAVERTLL